MISLLNLAWLLLLGAATAQELPPRPSAHLRASHRNLQEEGTPAYYTTADLGAVNLEITAGNPMKGLMTNPNWHGSSYNQDIPSSLEFYYIPFNDVMVADPDIVGTEAAFDWSKFEMLLQESASRSKHAIPRFYLHYPKSNYAVPDYLKDKGVTNQGDDKGPDYTNLDLLNAIQLFIQEFASKYDGDKRIAFIQLGILGRWGEWNGDDTLLPDSSKTLVATWYLAAFSQTMLQTRYTFPTLDIPGIGYHDDSFAFSTLDGEPNGGEIKSWFFWHKVDDASRTDFWKTGVMGGETRPELQDTVFSPGYPAGTPYHQDFDLCVDTTHATYMLNSKAFKSNEDSYSGETLENARQSSARMGYSFHASKVSVSQSTANLVEVQVTLTQVGVAPFYYPLSLTLECTGATVEVTGVDTLVDQGESKVFAFYGVPATPACLYAVSVSFSSPYLYEDRPIKFAQGTGSLDLMLPLPPGGPIPTAPPSPVVSDAPTRAPVSIPSTSAPTTQEGSGITGFTLMDASGPSDDFAIAPVLDGSVFDFAAVGSLLSLRADTSGDVGSVTFTWESSSHTEGYAPWAMEGNTGSDYTPATYFSTPGVKTVTATPASGSPLTVSFTLTNVYTNDPTVSPTKSPTRLPTVAPTTSAPSIGEPSPTPTATPSATPNATPSVAPSGTPSTIPSATSGIITGFTLFSSSTDESLGSVADGDMISLSLTGTSLNVVADMTRDVDKVIFYFDGNKTRTEGKAPYALGGNSGSNYFTFHPLSDIGIHTVMAEATLDGNLVDEVTITFEVVA